MARPVAVPITVSEADRAILVGWTRRRKTAQALALRGRIVLAAAKPGTTNTAIAQRLGMTTMTVAKWRTRFAAQGLAGLADAARPGAVRTITDAQIEHAITTTLETTPANATHWSSRGLAQHFGMSQSAIVRIWHAFGLAPHHSETFKLSTDPLFVAKVRDIIGLYLDPPERAVVLCVDEKPSIQAIEGTARTCPCGRASGNSIRMTTCALARLISSPPWMCKPAP